MSKKFIFVIVGLVIFGVISSSMSGGENDSASQTQANAPTLPTATTVPQSNPLTTTVEPTAKPEPTVNWANYSPAVKERLDGLATSKDCAGLQAEFDAASRNDNAQRQRTGAGNADLMRYIDAKIRANGCP